MSADILKIEEIYKTSGKNPNTYPLEIGVFTINAKDVPAEREEITNHCKTGCSLYSRNGGCPPHSPDYRIIATHYEHATILYVKLLTVNYPIKSLHGNHYVRWNFTETFMPKLLRKKILRLAQQIKGFPLVSGHCSGCRRCNYKEGLDFCKNPEGRMFSMESTGIHVEKLMATYSDSPLLWWHRDKPQCVPEYQIRVGLVLHNEKGVNLQFIRIVIS